MSDEDLIGFVIGALDADDRAAVESHLRADPVAAARLARFRLALAPLEADREPPPAPPELAIRTVARLAAYLVEHEPRPAEVVPSTLITNIVQSMTDTPPPVGEPAASRPLPRAPREEPETRAIGGRFRPDLLVACGIMLFASALVFSGVNKLRARNEMLACQNALRVTHTGLSGYADTHNDRYPQIGPNAPAGSFFVALANSGQIPQDFRPACPACPLPEPVTPTSAVGYTYTLGYRAPTGDLVGMRRPTAGVDEYDLVPISADYPAPGAAPAAGPVCPHTLGMNVLFAGGNVRTTTSPLIGPNGDHIFQNVYGGIGAGANRADVVLGRPGDRP
jgi:prepilin-type processing-associated H-X9-DG protein